MFSFKIQMHDYTHNIMLQCISTTTVVCCGVMLYQYNYYCNLFSLYYIMCVQKMVKDSPGPVGAESFPWPFSNAGAAYQL